MPTTITKTIGVGKDYASINAWVSGAASTYPGGLVAADVIWRGVLYQEGSGTNNEWVISSPTTAYALACDSTRYYLLEAASGQSFADNPNKLTNALRYNNANGVSISVSGAFVWLFDVGASARVFAKNLQIKTTVPVNTGSGRTILDKCLVSCSSTTIGRFSFSAQNSVLQTTNASGNVINTASVQNQYLVNCTVIGAGAAYAFVFGGYSSGNILRNCTFFGFSTGIANTVAPISAANSTYNITDLASFGWSATGNLVSKAAANQFVSVSSGSEDFRVKTGADVISAGTPDATYTSNVDIVGSARSTSAPPNGPTIGAWEPAVSSATTIYEFNSLNRGVGRGIARGIA